MSTSNTIPVKKPSPIAMLALQIALGQVGQREVPHNSNSGPMVDEYLKAVGLNPGYAWCQGFTNWCYEQAAKQMGVPEPVVNTGGVLDCWRRTAAGKKITRAMLQVNLDLDMILPGDQFIMKIGNKGAGHTGLIVSAQVKKGITYIKTVEGNTNDEGSREGYEVAVRERKLLMPELLGVIRY